MDDYLGNQGIALQLLMEPSVIFETGSIVFDYSAYWPGDLVITTAGDDERERAARPIRESPTVNDERHDSRFMGQLPNKRAKYVPSENDTVGPHDPFSG